MDSLVCFWETLLSAEAFHSGTTPFYFRNTLLSSQVCHFLFSSASSARQRRSMPATMPSFGTWRNAQLARSVDYFISISSQRWWSFSCVSFSLSPRWWSFSCVSFSLSQRWRSVGCFNFSLSQRRWSVGCASQGFSVHCFHGLGIEFSTLGQT